MSDTASEVKEDGVSNTNEAALEIQEPYPASMYKDRDEPDDNGCSFCEFMKGGPEPCPEIFRDWRKCVALSQERKDDMVPACRGATLELRKCLEANLEYYAPVVEGPGQESAEPVDQKEIGKELEKEESTEESRG